MRREDELKVFHRLWIEAHSPAHGCGLMPLGPKNAQTPARTVATVLRAQKKLRFLLAVWRCPHVAYTLHFCAHFL